MTRARRALPLVLGVALVATLSGCASDTERYCDSLADSRETLAGLASGPGDAAAMDQALQVFRDLRDDAPGDLEDEWSTLVFAYETLTEAFRDADVDPGEYDPAAPPPSLSDEQVRRIEGAAAELRTPRVMDAADGVEQHARDVCKVDLGLGSS